MLHTQCEAEDAMRSRASTSIVFLAFSVPLLWSIHPVQATPGGTPIQLYTLEGQGIVVHFERPLLEAAREIVRLFPLERDELAKLLQWQVRIRPEVVLIKDNRTFRMFARSELVVAFAEPERQVIVIDYSRMGVHPFELGVTFKHELCHLLLHAYIPAGLPRWFDEGMSQWVTGGLAEILTDDRRPVLGEAALTGRLSRFEDLSDRFPEDRYSLILAYEQSRSLVEYMAGTYGTPKLLQLLNALKNGSTMNGAMQNVLGLSLEELERRWISHLGQRVTWLIYVSNNLYEILFVFASLITILGAVRIIVGRLRGRTLWDEEDEE
jgi:hypothetical protein